MTNVDLSYVKFILSSEPTATIIRNLSTNDVSLVWEENGTRKSYYLETVTKERQKESERYWKKFIMECQEMIKGGLPKNEEIATEVQLLIQRTFDKKKK